MASYAELSKITVNVEVYSEKFELFDCEGVGVFVSPNGHVLTMSHLFKDDSNARIRVVNKDNVQFDCTILDVSPNLGLALLKVTKSEKFSFGTFHEGGLINGERIYAVGLPHFLDYSYPIGEISYPCRSYGEVLDYIKEVKDFKRDDETDVDDVDDGGYAENYVDKLEFLKLDRSVQLVQVNNIHGDGLGGSSGMPLVNALGKIIAIYAFAANDKCYGIHAQRIRSYMNEKLG